MPNENAMMLTIEGSVSKYVVAALGADTALKKNQGWFFIDFAICEVPVNTKFDRLLEGKSKKPILQPGATTVTLLAVIDQRGNNLETVPEGYSTICKLEFSPQIPAAIKGLPTLSSWNDNPDAISIANNQDIELAADDVL